MYHLYQQVDKCPLAANLLSPRDTLEGNWFGNRCPASSISGDRLPTKSPQSLLSTSWLMQFRR